MLKPTCAKPALQRYLLALASLLAIPILHANNLADCITKKVTFSGAPPLQYATVQGGRNSRLDVYPRYPQSCSHDHKSCVSNAYVLPGDEVAISKTCDGWAYVQYLGTRRVTVGWVEKSSLAALPAPPATKPPDDRYTNVGGLHPWAVHYRFTLTEGRGRPICEAYLQRLNQSEFYRPPYCGRPESTVVPGFVALRRQYLTAAEILSLVSRVDNFMDGVPQDRPDLGVEMGPKGAVRGANGKPVMVPAWRLKDITSAMDLQVWRYISKVDINNDGVPDDLIVWHGLGASSLDAVCGALYANNPEGQYVDQRAFILTAGGKIDEAETRAVFGSPNPVVLNGRPISDRVFVPIGYSIGIFQYKSKYYFDTFFNSDYGDFHRRRMNDKDLRYTLGVFESTAKHTRQVCEYEDAGAVAGEFLHSPESRRSP